MLEQIFPMDQDAINFFALKGLQGDKPDLYNANALTVRRVMQIIRDFSKKPFNQLKILDLACGEGVYAIEAALRGATVKALDARTERMDKGVEIVKRLNLSNIEFQQLDVRNVNIHSHGEIDIILFLGILYHLDQKDIFPVFKNLYEMCQQFVVIDTHIAMQGAVTMEYNNKSYKGKQWREHSSGDSEELRRKRLQSSIDNTFSFWFTKKALFESLHDVGFTSVCECNVPLDPFKSVDRITVIAYKGEPIQLSSYPWINNKTEDEIRNLLANNLKATRQRNKITKSGVRQFAKSILDGTLRKFGLEIRRL